MASAGPRGSSRESPMTRMRISVSSRMGTSEQRRRKKLRAERAEEGSWEPTPRAGEAPARLIWAQRGHCPPSPRSLVPDAHVDRAPQPCGGRSGSRPRGSHRPARPHAVPSDRGGAPAGEEHADPAVGPKEAEEGSGLSEAQGGDLARGPVRAERTRVRAAWTRGAGPTQPSMREGAGACTVRLGKGRRGAGAGTCPQARPRPAHLRSLSGGQLSHL